MVQTIAISEKTTLKYLRESFNLERTNQADFFPEWQDELPTLNDAEMQTLNRIRDRYFYQLDEGIMLENGVRNFRHPSTPLPNAVPGPINQA